MSETTPAPQPYLPEPSGCWEDANLFVASLRSGVIVYQAALSVEIFKQDPHVIPDWLRNYSALSFFSDAVERAFLFEDSLSHKDQFPIRDVRSLIMNADLFLRQTEMRPIVIIDSVERELDKALALLEEMDFSDASLELSLLADDEAFCIEFFTTEFKRVKGKIERFLNSRETTTLTGQYSLCMELRLLFLISLLAIFFKQLTHKFEQDLDSWVSDCEHLHKDSLRLVTHGCSNHSISKRVACCELYAKKKWSDLLDFSQKAAELIRPER